MRPIDQNPPTTCRSRPGRFSSPILFPAALAIGIAGTPSADAHHSFAQRVAGELQSMEIHDGTIELYKLLNPHSALIVRVDGVATGGVATGGVATGGVATGGDGSTGEDWLIELSSASTLGREGWTDDFLSAGDRVTVAILASRTPNRGRLRALLVHPDSADEAFRLIVAYGIRGDTPIMRRLQDRLPTCPGIDPRLQRGECFMVESAALQALEDDCPGKMGYVLP